MYVCMDVCMYAYTHTHTHIYIYMCVCVSMGIATNHEPIHNMLNFQWSFMRTLFSILLGPKPSPVIYALSPRMLYMPTQYQNRFIDEIRFWCLDELTTPPKKQTTKRSAFGMVSAARYHLHSGRMPCPQRDWPDASPRMSITIGVPCSKVGLNHEKQRRFHVIAMAILWNLIVILYNKLEVIYIHMF